MGSQMTVREAGRLPTWMVWAGIIALCAFVFAFRAVVPQRLWAPGVGLIVIGMVTLAARCAMAWTADREAAPPLEPQATTRLGQAEDEREEFDEYSPASLAELEDLVLAANGDLRRQLSRGLEQYVAGGGYMTVGAASKMRVMIERWNAGDQTAFDIPIRGATRDTPQAAFLKKLRERHDRSW